MPLTVEEYRIGQLHTIGEASLDETGGREGVEVVKNRPFKDVPLFGGRYTSGQYTFKRYHLSSKVPMFIRLLTPKGAVVLHEESWNAFPFIRTVITNPDCMKENFSVVVESLHLPGSGELVNVHELSPDKLKLREVISIDIANDTIPATDYKDTTDPTKFHSEKGDRGPLVGHWQNSAEPVMTCYKLVTVEFKWFGLQNRVESFLQRAEHRMITNFHRQVFCSMDDWFGLSLEEVRDTEDTTREQLNENRGKGEVRGMRMEEK